MNVKLRVVASVVVALGVCGLVRAQESRPQESKPAASAAGLIPRSVLFGNPEKAGAQISPDGTKLSFLAPVDGVLNVWVGPSGRIQDAKPVTSDTKRGIRQYFWAYTSQHVIFLQDTNGDENWRAFSVDLATGKTIPLTPFENVAVQVQQVSDKFPEEVVLGINDRDPSLHDLYRVNIRTGERTLMLQNDGFMSFSVDDNFKVRFGQKMVESGDVEEYKAVEKDGKLAFEEYQKIPREDTDGTGEIGYDATGNIRYVRDTRGRDTSAIFAVDLTSGEKKVVFQYDQCDAGQALIHPTKKTIQAVEYEYEKPRWGIIDRDLELDWQFLRKNTGDGTMIIASRSHDDRIWIVGVAPDNASSRTYLYDRGAHAGGGAPGEQKVTLLYVTRPGLQGRPLSSMTPVLVKTRDGLTMVCYLTLPPEADTNNDRKADHPLPMVLNVHGGPWARDNWGFDAEHQWLANRGYAVLSVNYRGSTGFGKKFLNASERQWGGKMHDDLIDAVNWAIKEKVADPAKIAIYGGSYGGYAALAGLTFTPETFACGVDIVGVSNLTTFMNTIPPYWKPFLEYMYKMVGDPRTEEGKQFLLDHSPVTHADKIVRPLLIAQGAHDPRVNKAESDQIVKAMTEKKIPVTYVVYPDEGHGFARPQNRQSFYAVAEAFLAKHLGGRAEPVGNDFKGSSITIEAGAEQVPGIEGAGGGK